MRTILLPLMLIAGCAHAELPSVRLVPAFPDLRFDRPLCIAHAGDSSGRVFVVEQAGQIHAISGESSDATSKVYLDIRHKVRTANNEEGLLAMAFHPDYSGNGRFFVYYSASDPRRGVLSQFTVSNDDANRADANSESVILEVAQPYGNHNGSTVVFGPDGFLYLSLGDGGSAGDPHGNGQNLGTLLATILRIDVDQRDSGLAYAIPPDNPFVGVPGARPEIWAYGLRNVWRMSFDRATGDFWAGDVGQDKWEEIDLIIRGGNYGWNLREGAHPYRGNSDGRFLIDPVVEYGRSEGASVTGGYVYRGNRYPNLHGVYIYADYVFGTIWGFRYADGKVTERAILLKQPNNISSFGETEAGEILVACFDGQIYWLEPSP